jgi:hypothetical protein
MADLTETSPAFICNGGRTVIAVGDIDSAIFLLEAKALLAAAGHERDAANLDDACIIRRHALFELEPDQVPTIIWNTEGTSDDWTGRVTGATPGAVAVTMTEV